jgi:DTW domain-containing protein YfiP
LIVHVRELKLTSNTAHFVHKMLPENSNLFIRGRMNDEFQGKQVLKSDYQELFLYPHEDAFELNAEFTQKFPGPYHLIVPDGNWHQARKVRQREESFKNIMAVKLPPGILTEYKLRKAPHPEWVCTYEAVAHALGALEGEEVRDRLLSFFRHWVKTAIFNRTKDENASL